MTGRAWKSYVLALAAWKDVMFEATRLKKWGHSWLSAIAINRVSSQNYVEGDTSDMDKIYSVIISIALNNNME